MNSNHISIQMDSSFEDIDSEYEGLNPSQIDDLKFKNVIAYRHSSQQQTKLLKAIITQWCKLTPTDKSSFASKYRTKRLTAVGYECLMEYSMRTMEFKQKLTMMYYKHLMHKYFKALESIREQELAQQEGINQHNRKEASQPPRDKEQRRYQKSLNLSASQLQVNPLSMGYSQPTAILSIQHTPAQGHQSPYRDKKPELYINKRQEHSQSEYPVNTPLGSSSKQSVSYCERLNHGKAVHLRGSAIGVSRKTSYAQFNKLVKRKYSPIIQRVKLPTFNLNSNTIEPTIQKSQEKKEHSQLTSNQQMQNKCDTNRRDIILELVTRYKLIEIQMLQQMMKENGPKISCYDTSCKLLIDIKKVSEESMH